MEKFLSVQSMAFVYFGIITAQLHNPPKPTGPVLLVTEQAFEISWDDVSLSSL